jgi:hypothetical protein
MATILFAWELGANLGHLIPLARIAAAFDGTGHRTVFALRDLASGRALLGPAARIVQAPVWPRHRHFGAASGRLASYVDILVAVGFADPGKLAAVAHAWNGLIDLVRPDVIVADHAPGLLVAVHGGATEIVAVGTGFTMPPLDYDHLPPLRGDIAPALPEARLLESVRAACVALGRRRPSSLIDVFRSDHRVVFGLPELDPYRSFRREPMVAPPGGLPGAKPWPRERRLFVYAGADMPGFEDLQQALAELEAPLEVYFRGDAEPAREFLRLRGATVHETPPGLDGVLGNASHILSQGGAGTVAAAYSAGRPQLVIASHDEARINLDLLRQAAVAHPVDISGHPADVAAAISRSLADPHLPDNALEAANRIARRLLPDGAEVAADAIRAALSAR